MKIISKRLRILQSRIFFFLWWILSDLLYQSYRTCLPSLRPQPLETFFFIYWKTSSLLRWKKTNCGRNMEHRLPTRVLFVMHWIGGFLASGWNWEARPFCLPDRQTWHPLVRLCQMVRVWVFWAGSQLRWTQTVDLCTCWDTSWGVYGLKWVIS